MLQPPPNDEQVSTQSADAARLEVLAEQFGVEYVDIDESTLDADLVARFPTKSLFRLPALPISQHGQRVRVAVSDPFKLEAMDELTVATGCFLDTVLAREEQIIQGLHAILGVAGGTVGDMVGTAEETPDQLDSESDIQQATSSSVGKIVFELLTDAVRHRASDIHIERMGEEIVIRYRIDGMLRVQATPPELHRFHDAIVSRLKIMASLNITEKRLPQDGRMNIDVAGRSIDIRASFIPMLQGEEVVLRLLDQDMTLTSLLDIGFSDSVLQNWCNVIRKPHGLVLVTGPTGSGKTTTLYSSLAHVRSAETKIITVEDPVEYNLAGISQIQVNDRIGLTFGAGVRSILRHDPDIILVGEIRDAETANTAIQASLTGHLVLSTLHTNDAASAFTRLVDMGIAPYLATSTLRGILAQRLVRRLCTRCREPYVPSPGELPDALRQQLSTAEPLFRAVGCNECGDTGYRGRLALFELMQIEANMSTWDENKLRAAAGEQGMETLAQSGWSHVVQGETTVGEVMRVCEVTTP